MSRRLRSALTVTDMFCGAGGSSIGVSAAGADLRLGLNHWKLAVEVHNTNFPDADHDCCDVSASDPRRYPSTDILVASPECTTHSLARSKDRALPLFDKPDPSVERSRATMWDVVRFTEYHRYRAVIVENVAEVVTRWQPFPAWLHAMDALGYNHRIVSLNSFAAPPTPQSRDRVYIVFWRKGNRAPDLDIRPAAWCPNCESVVEAIQAWKRPDRQVGKYRQQYVYVCPRCTKEAWPYAAPASTAIDWSIAGERIGDRARPLKPATLKRIAEGLRRYGRAQLVQTGGHTFARPGYVRAWPTDQPAPTQQASGVYHGILVPLRTNGQPSLASDAPAPTVCAGGNHHGLLVPLGHGNAPDSRRARPTAEPHAAQTGRQEVALVMDCRQGGAERSRDADRAPLSTVVAAGVTQALIMGNRTGGKARPVEDGPSPTVCTGESLALIFGHYGGANADGNTRPVTEPIGPVTANCHHALLVPYYSTGVARPTSEPVGAVTTRDRHALVDMAQAVDDCTFRMLEPEEIKAAMAFPADYKLSGTKRDRVKLAGNAVTPPVATLLFGRVAESLGGRRSA